MNSFQSLLKFFFVLVVATLLGSSCMAQLPAITNSTSTPVAGVGHDYIHAPLETVNPANGSVSIRIPIQLPPARQLNVPFNFAYDSNGAFYVGMAPNLGYHATRNVPFYNGGWSYTLPMVTFQGTDWTESWVVGQGSNSGSCSGYQNYVYADAHGDHHGLSMTTAPNVPFGGSNGVTCGGDPSGTSTGGEGSLTATTPVPLYGSATIPPVTITEADGTQYNFNNLLNYAGIVLMPSTIIDRNGNSVTLSASATTNSTAASATYVDTAGRQALSLSSFGANPDTIAVSGLSQGYKVYWTQVTPNFTITVNNLQGTTAPVAACPTQMTTTSTPVVSQIVLPNGQKFTFDYSQNPYGMLDEITYPSGGHVRYVWGLNPLAETGSWYAQGYGYNTVGSFPTGSIFTCSYDVPAITDRYVSFDGTTEPLHQHYVYSTTPMSGGFPQDMQWTAKQTTVTTTDTLAGTSFQTVYNYTGMQPPPVPPAEQGMPDLNNPATTPSMPVEHIVQYYNTNGSLTKTVTKSWCTLRELCSEQTTLNDVNLTGGATYLYNQWEEETDSKEFDYGVSTSGPPSRETVTSYAPFTAHIVDKPSSVLTYGAGGASSGPLVSGTTYAYDQTAPVPPQNGSPTGFTSSGNFGNLTTQTSLVTGSSGLSTTYVHDTTGQVISSADPSGNITQFFYADSFSAGGPTSGTTNTFVTQIKHADGTSDHFSYAYATGKLTSHTDPNSQQTVYAYSDVLTRLTGITYPDGGTETVVYTDTPLSMSMEVKRQIDSSHSTDAVDLYNGLLLTIAHSAANGEGTPYDRTDACYDGNGHVTFSSYPYQVASSTAAPNCSGVGDKTTYDALNRVTSVTHSDGSSILTSYKGRATQVQDEGNGTRSVDRISQSDYFGDLLSVCEVTSATQQGSSGAPLSDCSLDMPSGQGFLTSYTYNGAGDLTAVSQAGLTTRSFTYDLASRLLASANPETGTVNYTYDSSDANCSNYSHPGALVERRDARGIYTCVHYDSMNRIIVKSYTDNVTPSATFGYGESSSHGVALLNTLGRISSESTGGGSNATAQVFSYDPMGRVKIGSQCTPQNCASGMFSVTANYDFLGDETSFSSPWYTFSQTYNVAGRLTSVTSSLNDNNHPGGLLAAVNYTALGAPNSAKLGNGISEIYSYLPQGRLQTLQASNDSTPASGSVSISGTEQGVDTGYWDEECRRWYEGGDCAQWEYVWVDTGYVYDAGSVWINVNGHQDSVGYGQGSTASSIATSLASAISADAGAYVTATASSGTITLTDRAGGSVTDYSLSAGVSYDSYDFSSASFTDTPSGGNLTGGVTGAANVYSLALAYDPNGNVATANDSVNGNWTYSYDDFNRISTAFASNMGLGCSWAFDQFGNRWQQNPYGGGSCPQPQLSFSGANNHADQFSYDVAGNTIKNNDALHCFAYDAEGRITTVFQLDCATFVASYVYDAEGRRVQKTTAGSTVSYLYDLAGHQISEINSSGWDNRDEIFAGSRHLATYNNGTTYFSHEDWLGTERARSNYQGPSTPGSSCESITSLPYGDGQTVTGSCGDESPMHFTGKMRDTESNLDDFDARYYSSQWGRFTIPDWDLKPAAVPYANFGDPQSLNLYAYVRNNPTTALDPSGHACDPLLGNSGSGFCIRAMAYTIIDADLSIRNQTRFFAAAAKVSEALADSEAWSVVSRWSVSDRTAEFLNYLGSDLGKMNGEEAKQIKSGALTGPDLDAKLVNKEQDEVQTQLDKLKDSDSKGYTKVIDEANKALNPGKFGRREMSIKASDREFLAVLDEVRHKLGRNIDFANKDDRVLIGTTLIVHARKNSTGCQGGVNGCPQPH